MTDSFIKMNIILGSQDKSKDYSKDYSNSLSSIVTYSDILQKASETKILEFIKVIGIHRNSAQEIKELKNGFFASYGAENRILIYDRSFNLKKEGEDIGDRIYHILEITSQERIGKDIQLIICTIESVYLNQINLDNNNTPKPKKFDLGGLICLEIKNNNYVICGEDGAFFFSDLFSKIIQSKKNKLFEETFRGGLVINPNLVAFSSNKLIPGGDDKLKFYNPNSKKIVKEYLNYSFIMASNGLALLENEKTKDSNKIFLAACKKYHSNQKDGILTIISSFNDYDSPFVTFEEIDNFEVYCFCRISIIKNENLSKKIIDKEKNEKENIEILPTNYFFIGGFDTNTRYGLIKLYKAIFSDNPEETKIEYIQDIVIEETIREIDISQINVENEFIKNNNSNNEPIKNDNSNNESIKNCNSNNKETNKELSINVEEKKDLNSEQKLRENAIKKLKEMNSFKGFKGPVTSIIQSSSTGNILVTCHDGKVYLFTPPNLDYYLSNNAN